MVRDFHRVIGEECLRHYWKKAACPMIAACVGGGSNAIGIFFAFLRTLKSNYAASKPAGVVSSVVPCCSFRRRTARRPPRSKTWILQSPEGQIDLTHSVSAGLDYAAVGPEHAQYKEKGRIDFGYATDAEALQAFKIFARSKASSPH